MPKVVIQNIRHGGGTRIDTITRWLVGQDADFILLTEWRENSAGEALASSLFGLGYQVEGFSRSSSANGILVASRHDFASARITPADALAGELIRCQTRYATIVCGYFPQGKLKAPFFDAVMADAGMWSGVGLLIGDLNTGRNDIDLEQGATKFACADKFENLTKLGNLTDLWRHSNGQDAREWTWCSSKNGFRIDHAFGNRHLMQVFPETSCHYDHHPRNAGMSDHSGMIINLM